MLIKKNGISRITTKKKYQDMFKDKGFEIVEVEEVKDKEKIDIEEFSKGGGWYEYEGKSYRKDELLEKLEE